MEKRHSGISAAVIATALLLAVFSLAQESPDAEPLPTDDLIRVPSHGEGNTPRKKRPVDDGSIGQSDDPAANVQKYNPLDEVWWESVNLLIDSWIEKRGRFLGPLNKLAKDFSQDLSEDSSKALKAAVGVRFDNAIKLRDSSFNEKMDPSLSRAAENEVKRRLEEPVVQFLAANFHIRKEKALEMFEELTSVGSEGAAGIGFAQWMGTINKLDRFDLYRALRALPPLTKPRIFYRRLTDAAAISLVMTGQGKVVKPSPPDRKFKAAMEKEYALVLRDNEIFHQQITAASLGSDEAKKAMGETELDGELYADTMARQYESGNKLAAARMLLAAGPSLRVKLTPRSTEFLGDRVEDQVIQISDSKKDADQISQALAVLEHYHRGNAETLNEERAEGSTDADQQNRFNLFSIQVGKTKASGRPVKRYAVLDGKTPLLTHLTSWEELENKKLASAAPPLTRALRDTTAAPVPPVPRIHRAVEEPAETEEEVVAPVEKPSVTAERVNELLDSNKCNNCHDTKASDYASGVSVTVQNRKNKRHWTFTLGELADELESLSVPAMAEMPEVETVASKIREWIDAQ